MLPPKDKLNICFAHSAYQMAARFAARGTGIAHFQVWKPEEMAARLPEADVVVVSMMWKNDLVPQAKRLKFIQSISAGIDQYDQKLFREQGIRLANAAGVNAAAVSEHAMATDPGPEAAHLHTGRDNQAKKLWRGMISNIPAREDRARRQDSADCRPRQDRWAAGQARQGVRPEGGGDAARSRAVAATASMPCTATTGWPSCSPSADIVALTCPLTPQTTNLIDAKALALMKPTAHLINVARGRVVDEDALIRAAAGEAHRRRRPRRHARGAAAGRFPLWAMPNVLITPHTAGETQRYEDGVIDLLLENLDRLWRGETTLVNQIV